MGEASEIASVTGLAVPTPTTVAPIIVAALEESATDAEIYSVVEKALFFAAVLGCVGVYMRMNSKKDKKFGEKSIA